METVLVTLVLLIAVGASGVFRGLWRPAPGARDVGGKARANVQASRRLAVPRTESRAVGPPPDSAGEASDRGQLRQLAVRLSRIETALDSGEAVLPRDPWPRSVDLRRRVLALAKVGMEPSKMARELGVSLGEVELALRMGAAATAGAGARSVSRGRP